MTGSRLSNIAHMTSLTELQLMCNQAICDAHPGLLPALTLLTELKTGPLKRCSSEGLINTLSHLCRLDRLSLNDAITFSDECLACVSAALSGKLQALSHNCSWITAECVARLSMPHLSRLCLSKNAHTSMPGVAQFIEQCPVLVHLDLRECASLDLTQLLVKMHTQPWHNRRKSIEIYTV